MDLGEWLAEAGKVAGGAVVGVFAATRRMEARVRALEERANKIDAHAEAQDATLGDLHKTVTADHDLLTKANAKLDLIMESMSLRPKLETGR